MILGDEMEGVIAHTEEGVDGFGCTLGEGNAAACAVLCVSEDEDAVLSHVPFNVVDGEFLEFSAADACVHEQDDGVELDGFFVFEEVGEHVLFFLFTEEAEASFWLTLSADDGAAVDVPTFFGYFEEFGQGGELSIDGAVCAVAFFLEVHDVLGDVLAVDLAQRCIRFEVGHDEAAVAFKPVVGFAVGRGPFCFEHDFHHAADGVGVVLVILAELEEFEGVISGPYRLCFGVGISDLTATIVHDFPAPAVASLVDSFRHSSVHLHKRIPDRAGSRFAFSFRSLLRVSFA